jgi:DNA gyrase subunit A
VIRRTRYDLAEAEKKAHILEGLIIACDNIDEVVRIIRASRTPADAQRALEQRFQIDELQSKAIVDMRLSQLTGLRIDELHAQYEELEKLIAYYKQILADDVLCMKVVKDELVEIKEKYGDERRTTIDYRGAQFNAEDFIPNDEVMITISHMGYIKRTLLSDFRAQSRGGVGSKGSGTRDSDFIEYMYIASNHNWMLFFTQKGRCFWTKVYDLPEATKQQKGRAIQNMLNIDPDDKITAFIRLDTLDDAEFNDSHYLIFATKQGIVKKTRLAAYSRPRSIGINAIKINEGDEVIRVVLTDGKKHIVLANRNGRAITFPETKIRAMGRVSTGVRGMRLDSDGQDELIGMVAVDYPGIEVDPAIQEEADENEVEEPSDELFNDKDFEEPEETADDENASSEDVAHEADEPTILVVSEKGFGKRSAITDYRITNRGGKGVKTLNITDKTGPLTAIKVVTDNDDLMIINKSGIVIRLHLNDVRVMGRATQGVRLINLEKKGDHIASVCRVDPEDEEEVAAEEGAEAPEQPAPEE